jgi:hypothetical protein
MFTNQWTLGRQGGTFVAILGSRVIPLELC